MSNWDGTERRKRGRPRISDHEKLVVKMQIRVTTAMADALYSYARKQRTDVSKITQRFFARLIASELTTDEKYNSTVTH